MEPHHELRFTDEQIPDLRAELESLGFSVTSENESWLGDDFPEFCDIIAERGGERAVLAVHSGRGSAAENSIVYLNLLHDTPTQTIRKHLEQRGAQWGYFSPGETDAVQKERG